MYVNSMKVTSEVKQKYSEKQTNAYGNHQE